MSRRRDDEPYFEVRCNGCGATFHAGDGDGACPSCDATSVSYDSGAAREWSAWRDDQGRRR